MSTKPPELPSDRSDGPRVEALPVVIVGAGIAGLTGALALAARGIPVRVVERAPELTEIGAGLQLSPNATGILRRLGVLDALGDAAVRPQAILLRRASDLREVARVPLGAWAEERWGAPYLTAHRADLQTALLQRVAAERSIRMDTGTPVEHVGLDAAGPTVIASLEGKSHALAARWVVAADGVRSSLRQLVRGGGDSRSAGHVAWRVTLDSGDDALRPLAPSGHAEDVTALLDGGFHLVAYPMRGGRQMNLVAFTPGGGTGPGPTGGQDAAPLRRLLLKADRRLAALARTDMAWTHYPMHMMAPGNIWLDRRGLVLIGDAAHAMTPFAAQGAAMAIEDAETLAAALAGGSASDADAIERWQALRRERVERVARRGAFNHFVWNAAGPAALARDLVLRLRSPGGLAADLDWLYGWKPPGAGTANPVSAVSG